MIYVGIDPGASGAWAALGIGDVGLPVAMAGLRCLGVEPTAANAVNQPPLAVAPLPLDAYGGIDVRRLRECWAGFPRDETIVVIEKTQSMPGNGGSAMFTYGKGVGRIEALLLLEGWRFEEVRPTTWKNVVLRDTAKDKAAAIDYVTRVFPGVSLLPTPRSKKPHDGMADALCLAEYGRRAYGAASGPTP